VASTAREWAVTALTHSASSGSRSPRWPRQLSVASSRASVASRSSLRGVVGAHRCPVHVGGPTSSAARTSAVRASTVVVLSVIHAIPSAYG
jgi:hypothetical protein